MLGEYIGPRRCKYNTFDDSVAEHTSDWLSGQPVDGEPWCLFVGLVAPHFPLVVPQEWFDLYPARMVNDTKLHPSTGYVRHPWVEFQNRLMDFEGQFRNNDERLAARSSYFGLCSCLDHNVGLILDTLEASGKSRNTVVAYTSDHGDNAGERRLWG